MKELKESKLPVRSISTPATTRLVTELTVTDSLNSDPISLQIKKHGHEVYEFIDEQIYDACLLMDIEVEARRRQLLVEEIVALYGSDTLEDIAMALRDIRRGKFPMYNKLNMEAINLAMEDILYAKAALREAYVSSGEPIGHEWANRTEYLEAVKKGSEMSVKQKELKRESRTKHVSEAIDKIIDKIPNEKNFEKETGKRGKSS